MERAKAGARLRGLDGSCEFRVRDNVEVDLSIASVVFLHGPSAAVRFMQKRVLPRSGLPQGAIIFSSGEPLSEASFAVVRVSSPELEHRGLFCYYVCQEIVGTKKPIHFVYVCICICCFVIYIFSFHTQNIYIIFICGGGYRYIIIC